MDEDGAYVLDDEGRFGPYELAWEYTAENKEDFHSGFISGATRLPNGNTFICEGATGRYFEVNSAGKILWEHVNTFGGELNMEGRPNDVEKEAQLIIESGEGNQSFVENNALFRATKYRPDYAGLAGRELAPLLEQPVPFAALVEDAVVRLKAEAAKESATERVASEQPNETAEGGDEAESPDAAEEANESVDETTESVEPDEAAEAETDGAGSAAATGSDS